MKIRAIAIFLLTLQFSCGLKTSEKEDQISVYHKNYLVDPNIELEIIKSLKQFDSSANASIIYRSFEGEKILSDNFDSNIPVAALAFTNIIDSVIAIDCFNGIDDGFGYSLIISKDTSFVRLHLQSKDSLTFSNNMQSLPEYSLFVPSSRSKIILTKSPKFLEDEIIQGYVELTSEYFFERTNENVRKLKFQLRSYFQSEPMTSGRSYKTLRKK